MHITLEADYAVRMVFALCNARKRLSAQQLAEFAGISVRFALKILQKMTATDLVLSFKGVKGGYELAHEPQEISLYDIVSAVDGPIHIARCVTGEYACTRPNHENCSFQCAFEEVSSVIRAQLKQKTMDQFVHTAREEK